MMKISIHLLVVFVIGIFFISVSSVGASVDFFLKKSDAATDQQSTGIDQKGDYRVGMTPDEDDPITRRKSVESSQPRQPGTRLEPGDNFRPGAADTPQRQNLPRGQRGIGGVIPPDFDDDATNR